jgi:hypothetical protein
MNKNRPRPVSAHAMKMFVVLLVAGAAPFLSSCQSTGESRSLSSASGSGLSKSRSAGMAGTTGQAGTAGSASSYSAAPSSESPFAPGPLPPSARYREPDRYWGYGGGYSKTKSSGGGAIDDYNFLRDNVYSCHGYYWGSCYAHNYGNCYSPRYSSCSSSYRGWRR